MYQEIKGVSIEAVSACVPSNRIENSYFNDLLDPKELRKFEKTTGIRERRYAENHVTASDLGFIAASKILKEQDCKDQIKAVVFVSQTSDYKIPFTSNILQSRLGLKNNILCLDLNAGCAGFVQALSVVFSLNNTINGKSLLIIGETLSKILSKNDRSTSMLFGDGASALLIGRDDSLTNSSYFNFFSDGENHDAIIIPDGGYRNPFSESSLVNTIQANGEKRSDSNLLMDGPRVFDFTLRELPKSLNQLLKKFNLDKEEIDAFLFHQSNRFIIKQISKKLGVPISKVPMNIDLFGNTSGVSIPLLLVTEYYIKQKNTPRSMSFTGYGSGLNWGNCVLTLPQNINIYQLIEA